MKTIETLDSSPFKHLIMTIGELPASYVESMTYYEMLAWLCNYVQKTVIPAVNNNAEAVAEIQHWIETLDLQDEVDHKLDQMAEDGTLQEIITTYIQSNVAWTFDTVADMKNATNLIAGSYAQTLGFRAKGDGGGAIYKISNTGTADEMSVIAIGDLYAEIVPEKVVTPEMFGAYGDLEHDDTDCFNKAFEYSNNVRADKTYKVQGSISLISNSKLFGKGILRQPNGENQKLLNIDSVENVEIDGLTICNESSQTGTPLDYGGQYLIYINQSNKITIKNCSFRNAYKRGIEVYKSSNIIYSNNTFVNATYDMVLLFPEVSDVLVENSTFDNITSDLNVAYLFATGGDDYSTTFEFLTKNITINNCKFLNNPKWEGADTHGCLNFTFTNNYVYNCYRGCMAKYDSRLHATVKHGNLVFRNNKFEGTNVSTQPAITSGGDATFFAKNITIEDNEIDNWGASGTNNNAAIDIQCAKHVDIIRNKVTNSKGSHLYLTNITYGNVNENVFLECGRGIALLPYVGCWFINVKNNIIRNLKVQRQNAFNFQGIINIEGNDIEGFNTPFYGTKTNMTGLVSQYTTQMGKNGNYVRNGYQIITHYCTDPVVRANKAETMAFTATVINGSTDVETSARFSYDLCEGEEIVIAGAGNSGADLTTIIDEVIDETHFKVRDMANTGVSNAAISVTASTWQSI